MSLLFLLFFALTYSDNSTTTQQLGNPPAFSSGFTIFNQVLLFPSMVFYVFATFAAICYCKPENMSSPSCAAIVFQFFTASILLISAFLGYAGTNILSFNNNKGSTLQNKYLADIYDFIQDPFQKSVSSVMNIYENVTKNNLNSISSTLSLINLTTQYNSTFTENNGKYRVSFNDIYFNPNTGNYLKVSLKGMDKSRNLILSQILLFTEKYGNFSQSIKNTLSSISKNYFSKVEKSSQIIEKRYNNIRNEILSIYVLDDMFVPEMSYILSTCILVMAILYSIIFFCSNCCSRCCFCIYPFFALLVVLCSFGTCYFITKGDYKPFEYSCKKHSVYSEYGIEYAIKGEISQLFYDISDIFTNSSFEIDENLKNFFNEKDLREIEGLIQKINSKSLHDNYATIYHDYAPNPDYTEDLVEMVRIIKQNEKKLKQMKEFVTQISDFSFTVYPTLIDVRDKMNGLFESNLITLKADSLTGSGYSFCGKLLNGINCCVWGQFLLLIGLFLMLVSVCFRRVDMDGYISIANSFDKFVMGDEVQGVYNFNYADSEDQQDSNGQPKSIEDLYPKAPLDLDDLYGTEVEEGIWKVYLGTRIVYHATTYEAAQSILNDMHLVKGSKGMFGPGIYFAATMEIAKHKSRVRVGAYVICKVDFGYAIVLGSPCKNLTLEDIREYGCDSVMGRSGPNTNWEFIVYESERTRPLQMIRLKPKDIDNNIYDEEGEDEEGGVTHMYFGTRAD